MPQTIEEQVGDLVTASNLLTTAIENKIIEIDLLVQAALDSAVKGQGKYKILGENLADIWVDIGDITSASASFALYALSTENNYIQPQEWAFVYKTTGSITASVRVDSYAVLHTNSNDLFFRVNLVTGTLQAKKTLITNRYFSVHLKINDGSVVMRESQEFNNG